MRGGGAISFRPAIFSFCSPPPPPPLPVINDQSLAVRWADSWGCLRRLVLGPGGGGGTSFGAWGKPRDGLYKGGMASPTSVGPRDDLRTGVGAGVGLGLW